MASSGLGGSRRQRRRRRHRAGRRRGASRARLVVLRWATASVLQDSPPVKPSMNTMSRGCLSPCSRGPPAAGANGLIAYWTKQSN